MGNLLLGIIAVVIGCIVIVVYNVIKSIRDPDMQAASNLRMSIKNYKLYERIYDEHWDCMMKYGSCSKEAEQLFAKLIRDIQDPNEWKRYQDYRARKQQEEMMSEIMN